MRRSLSMCVAAMLSRHRRNSCRARSGAMPVRRKHGRPCPADRHRLPDLAPEAAGLHAVSLGLSALAGDDDHGLLERGFMVYDAQFA
jgi:hypothetical protein